MPLLHIADTSNDQVLPQPLSDHRTAPQHLRAAAYLYGLETAALEAARVLELGCGGGTNLLSFAQAYPGTQVVGVDIDPAAISWGQQRLAEQKIQNLQIFSIDLDTLLELGDELGTYQYIIVRGVFSVLDPEVRARILAFCQAHLTDDGIACIDYPTYPGARSIETLRDALMFHSSLVDTEEEKVQAARAMLGFMAQGISDENPAKSVLEPLIEQAESQPSLTLSLQYLQDLQRPSYFIEFADSLASCSLTYVGDADAHTEVPRAWGKQVEQWCSLINPDNKKVLGQQYLDFLCNRNRRLSIVTHQRHAQNIFPEPDLDRLKDLRWAGYFIRSRNTEEQPLGHHVTADGGPVSSPNEMVSSIMDHLGYAWPLSLDYSALLFNTRPVMSLEDEAESKHIENLERALQSMFLLLGDKLHLTREPSAYDRAKEEHLSLVSGGWLSENMAGSSQAGEKRFRVINGWQGLVELQLSTSELNVLRTLNGSSDPADWVAAYAGHNSLQSSEQSDSEDVSKLISRLARLGLLRGTSSAWLEFHRFAQSTEKNSVCAAWHSGPIMMQSFTAMREGCGSSATPEVDHGNNDHIFNQAYQRARLVLGQDLERAELLVTDLTERFSHQYGAWYLLCRVRIAKKQYADCLEPGLKAVALRPDLAVCYVMFAVGLKYQRQPWLSQHVSEIVLRLDPSLAAAWDLLGSRYAELGFSELGLRCTQRAAQLDPGSIDILSNLARSYGMQMRLDESLECLEKALKAAPEQFFLHTNYLFNSLHHIELDPNEIFQRHLQFGRTAEIKSRKSGIKLIHKNEKDKNRKLNIGFVSGDFRDHPVARFLEPYLKLIDKRKFSLHVYHNSFHKDKVTERLQGYVDSWLDVFEISDERLAQRINDDEIDILFDLSGHTADNRLPVFAYKPAPVQITWQGYPGSTGLKTMDYKITADCNDLDHLKRQFTEKFILMPTRVLFQNHAASPEVNELPMSRRGYITFGSFNRIQKLSDRVLEVWAEILRQLPDAHLLIANIPDQPAIEKFCQKLGAMGVNVERVEFRLRERMEKYLFLHHEVDVLLDTFPYNGGTTTNHALWMGVPTLTLAGETLACRHGVPLMTQYELTDFISYSIDDYIEKAVALAGKEELLAGVRSSMRNRIESRKVAVEDQVESFSKALREAWGIWCAGEPPRAFKVS